MKNTIKTILSLLCGAAILASCTKDESAKSVITVDVTAFNEVAASNPADLAVSVTSNVNWIVQTPSWITPSASYGSGNAIVTFKVGENYVNETTTVQPRSGEIKISGGGAMNGDGVTVTIPVKQSGFTYIDPAAPVGGIATPDHFVDFLKAVAGGTGTSRWEDESGEVVLLDNVDLSEVTEYQQYVASVINANNDCTIESNAFSGTFNGNGYRITGFNPTVELAANQTFGLFPAVNEAVIKNVILEGSMTISATGQSDAGLLVGTSLNSTIQNVTVNGTLYSTGTEASTRFALGGIIGFACATGSLNNLIENCTSNVAVEAVGGANTANGGTCAMYGGIAGFSTYNKGEGRSTVRNCVNNGNMTVTLGRCSGIVATPNGGTVLDGCTNNGDQVNAISNGRLANICCVIGQDGKLVNCVNNGDLEAMTSGGNGTCAGLVALLNHATVSVDGGGNYGVIRTDRADGKYVGLLVANFSKFATVSNVVVSGGIEISGAATAINEGNFMDYIGTCSSANLAKVTGLTWVAPAN